MVKSSLSTTSKPWGCMKFRSCGANSCLVQWRERREGWLFDSNSVLVIGLYFKQYICKYRGAVLIYTSSAASYAIE